MPSIQEYVLHVDYFVTKGNRVVIPASLKKEMLNGIGEGHLKIE